MAKTNDTNLSLVFDLRKPNVDIKHTVIKRNIKNPRLEFKHGDLFVIVPTRGVFDVEAFVVRHARWIKKHSAYYESLKLHADKFALEPRLAAEFQKLVTSYLDEAAEYYKVEPKELRFKTLRSRWGSCTNTGIITINLKLRYFSDDIIRYVVCHEVVHMRVRKHDRNFYALLAGNFPNFKDMDKNLTAYEYLLHKSEVFDFKFPKQA